MIQVISVASCRISCVSTLACPRRGCGGRTTPQMAPGMIALRSSQLLEGSSGRCLLLAILLGVGPLNSVAQLMHGHCGPRSTLPRADHSSNGHQCHSGEWCQLLGRLKGLGGSCSLLVSDMQWGNPGVWPSGPSPLHQCKKVRLKCVNVLKASVL